MSLKEQVYSVLVVSASEKINQALTEIFVPSVYSPLQYVSGVSAAKRAVAERDFDFVLINSPLPDDSGLQFAIDTVTSYNTVVLFLARAEEYSLVFEKLAPHGVFLMQKPVSKSTLLLASEWLVSARERIRRSEKKTLSIEEKMNEIRLVNRAKWLLISELKMTEPDAHRYIEKQAMDRCISKQSVAEEIIKTYG
ncbi:MAG: ANTAR domain-containing protein [Clostridia bacterium]|nr:ANTAR domain-containing protein [Clostridia bacterium]MBO4861263.1 ANTAR domain-containing protein [Clostridia bacterium]MBP5238493.1 ANTAR domain-containing protein [Clostridia bacterium]